MIKEIIMLNKQAIIQREVNSKSFLDQLLEFTSLRYILKMNYGL